MTIIHNFKWLFSYQVLRLAVGFLLGAWVARVLGPADFGILSTASATGAIAYVMIELGMRQLLTKEISQRREHERVIVGTAFKLWLLSGVVITALIGLWNATGTDGPRIPWVVWWAALLPQMLSCLALHHIWEEASHRAYVVVRNGMIAYLTCAAVRLACLIWWPKLSVLAWTVAAETLLLGVLGMRTSHRLGRGWWPAGWDPATARKLLRIGSLLMLGQAGTLLLLRADTVMIEHMRGEAEAGIYGGAIRLSEMAYLLATMVITVLLPKLSERIAHSSPEHARELIRRGNELMVALSLLSSIALCIAGPMVIRWLLGPKYEASIPVLLVHCLSALPYFLSEWRNAVLVAQERATTCAWMAWLALIVNVGLNLLWIPQHGALGAAWATLISYAVGGLLTTWLVPDLRWLAQLQLQALISPFKWLARPRHAWIELQAIIARNAATAA